MAVVKELAAFDRRVGYDAYAPGGGELYRGAAWRYGSGGVDLQGGVRCSDQYGVPSLNPVSAAALRPMQPAMSPGLPDLREHVNAEPCERA